VISRADHQGVEGTHPVSLGALKRADMSETISPWHVALPPRPFGEEGTEERQGKEEGFRSRADLR